MNTSHASHEGDGTMPDSLQLSSVDYLAHERISDLYAAASETRSPLRRSSAERPGLLSRTRGSVGRRLISLGSAVAGSQA
jgi:hypothetical protein